MALPTSYLTSTKNVGAIFDAIKNAKAPDKFTTRYLQSLDFKSVADRLIIGVMKSLGFLDAEGRPKERYFKFLDQTQSPSIMAEAIEEAYADLYQTNKLAHTLSKQEVINKCKTLSQGQLSESVLDKMAATFLSLAKLADFQRRPIQESVHPVKPQDKGKDEVDIQPPVLKGGAARSIGGLHYNIQIILPESRDPKVYDALFRSLKEHILS